MVSMGGRKGFTLLEVMIAIAVIAISLTALLGMHARSLELAGEAKFKTTASLLAQHKMAQLEWAGFENMTIDSGEFGEDFPGFRWEVIVQPADFMGLSRISEQLRRVELTVAWNDKKKFIYRLQAYPFIP